MPHCPPTGVSANAGQLQPPNFPGATVILPASGGVGNRRGVVVLMHGLEGPTFPVPLVDTGAPATANFLTLANDLVAQGWTVIWPTMLGDEAGGGQEVGVGVDLASATSSSGAQLVTGTGLWNDHAIQYTTANFPGWPVVPMGFSWGAYNALLWAINRTSTIAGYCAHCPATLLWQIAVGNLNFYDLAPKLSFTLASGENGLTLPQSTLTVNETISIQNPPQVGGLLVQTSNTLWQQLHYTSWATKTFSGITGGDGASTMATNGKVDQSSYTASADLSLTCLNALGNGSQGTTPLGFLGWETGDFTVGYPNSVIIGANAVGASQPVTTFAGTAGHVLDSTAVTNIMNWVTGALAAACPAVH